MPFTISLSRCTALPPPYDLIASWQGTNVQGELTAMLARVGLLPPQRVLNAPLYGMIAVVTYDTRHVQLEEYKRSSAQLVGSHYCSTPEVMKALQWLSGDWNDQVRHSQLGRPYDSVKSLKIITNTAGLEHHAVPAPNLICSGMSGPPPSRVPLVTAPFPHFPASFLSTQSCG